MDNNGTKIGYTMAELVKAHPSITARTVRYYVNQGLLPKPTGKNRYATYLPLHLRLLQQIKTMQEGGLSLDEIRVRLQEQMPPAPPQEPCPWIRLRLTENVEVQVRMDLTPKERLKIEGALKTFQEALVKEEQTNE